MDMIGLTSPATNVASIKAKGPYGVAITLKTVDSQFIPAVLNGQFVVPQHIWSKVSDPATFTNPNPVGSGPFNKVARFTSQDYVLTRTRSTGSRARRRSSASSTRRPRRTTQRCCRSRAARSTGRTTSCRTSQQAYIAKDTKHYHAFYATTAYPISLVLDTTKYPYSIPAFRKALSLAINRSDVSKLGEYGYAPPTDALGLNGIFPQWVTGASRRPPRRRCRVQPDAREEDCSPMPASPTRARTLIDPKGNPVKLDIHVISGWSDWVASNQIITKNLQAIGIDSNVALEPDWNSWYPNASSTKAPTLLWQNASQGSPFGFFNSNLSRTKYTPPGEDATNTGNWAHYQNAKATALLNQWKSTLSVAKQKQIASQLGELFLQDQPIVPLFVGPRWSTYTHEVLPLLLVAEELLRRPDLHDGSRQHPLVHANLPWRQGRRVTVG